MSKLSDTCKEQAKEIKALKERIRMLEWCYQHVLKQDADLRSENDRLQKYEYKLTKEK